MPKKIVQGGFAIVCNTDILHGIVKDRVERVLLIKYKEECNKKVSNGVNTLIPFSAFETAIDATFKTTKFGSSDKNTSKKGLLGKKEKVSLILCQKKNYLV